MLAVVVNDPTQRGLIHLSLYRQLGKDDLRSEFNPKLRSSSLVLDKLAGDQFQVLGVPRRA